MEDPITISIKATVNVASPGGATPTVTPTAAPLPHPPDARCAASAHAHPQQRPDSGASGGPGHSDDGGPAAAGRSHQNPGGTPSSTPPPSAQPAVPNGHGEDSTLSAGPGGTSAVSKDSSWAVRAVHPDLVQGTPKAAENGYSPTRLQYLKAMSQIKGAAKRIERDEKVQVLKRLGDFFQDSDKDSDGQLTISELTRSLRRAGYRGSDAEIKKFFRLADISDDQLISKEEFVNVMLRAPTLVHREMTMRRVFTKFDKDGNGSIDKDELKLVFEELGKLMPEEEITRMMSMADKDESGALEYEEFIEIVIGNRKRRDEFENKRTASQDSS